MTYGPLCGGCPLQRLGSGFARTDGSGRNGILLVGEALGKDEVGPGLPFQGAAGRLLNRMLSRRLDPDTNLPLGRDDFLIANIINCRPPDNDLTKTTYETGAINHCAPYLIETITKAKPRVIVALGNQALRWFTGEWGIDSLRGYVFQTRYGPVIGTYHPAYIMRGKFPYTKVFQQDILKALYVARHGIPTFQKDYITHPTVAEAFKFLAEYKKAGCPVLSFDIETPYSKGQKDTKDEGIIIETFVEDDPSYRFILRISFSYVEGKAISFPWIRPFDEIARLLLALPGDKLVWNKHFDVPRLIHNGAVFSGRIYDGMDAWHFLEPSLPMGLKYAATFYCPDMHAWKLDSRAKPEWYNAADSEVALRVFNGVRRALEDEGRWRTFERHYVDLSTVLGRMSKRGVNVDRAERKARREEFEGLIVTDKERLQEFIPVEVKPKKIFKLKEERLKKEGKWKNNGMVLVSRMEEVKEPKPKKEKVKKTKGLPLEGDILDSSTEGKLPKKTRKKRALKENVSSAPTAAEEPKASMP